MWVAVPGQASAQFSDPCSVQCGLVLGATSFAVASGTAAAVGRLKGGFTTSRQGIVAWGTGFLFSAGAGMVLSGNGERQEHAIYVAGLGALGGSLVALASEALIGDSTPEQRLAATLVGAAVGALVGGAYGAITWDDSADPGVPANAYVAPVFSFAVGF
jgi:hypothetical protein